MKAIERRNQTSGQVVPLRYSACKHFLRLGCAALVVALAIGSVTFLRGFAAEDGAAEAAVSGSDLVSASDLFAETVEPKVLNANIVDSGTCGANVNWTLDSEGTLTISGSGAMENKTYETHSSEIKRVVIEDGVTSIGDYAFCDCRALTSIHIPDSVTSIGEGAFENCNFTSVMIPDGVTSIEEGVFRDCRSLISVTIPDNLSSVGDEAFRECESLTSIHIPDGVTSIGDRAFWDCWSLTSIHIPDSVTSIGKGAFVDCESLTSANIPDGITSIAGGTFSGCRLLTSIQIPDSVTSIGESAFWRCGLTNPFPIRRTIQNSEIDMK